jgi:hypothetical protein
MHFTSEKMYQNEPKKCLKRLNRVQPVLQLRQSDKSRPLDMR